MSKYDKYLLELFDIAKYGAVIEDEAVYRRATQMLVEELYAYVGEQLDNSVVWEKGLSFTGIQIDLMKQILNMCCKPEQNFFSRYPFLMNIWFNPVSYVPFSEDTWHFIWHYMISIVDANKEDMFMQYWTYAEQYYRFSLEDKQGDVSKFDVAKEKVRFKQFHIGLGAYLLYKKKYSLLRKIFSFTQTEPPSYSFTDNTFVEILDEIKRIYDMLEHPLILTNKYPMYGLLSDVNSDRYIAGRFNAYFALLMVRLSLMGYNVSYCDPLLQPTIRYDATISDLNEQVRYVGVILNFLDKDELDAAIVNVGLVPWQKERALYLLGNYKKNLELAITNKEQFPETDRGKVNYIKRTLVEEIKNTKNPVPKKSDSSLSNDVVYDYFYCGQQVQVDKRDIAKYMYRISANMEEALVESMILQEGRLYNRFFLLNKPVITYTIRFVDLMKAWHKMALDNQYIILSLGVYLGTYTDMYGSDVSFHYSDGEGDFDDAKIISLRSSILAFAILPKSSLPYVEYVEPDELEKDKLVCIDEESMLYSNVESLDAKDNNVLKVSRKVRLVHRKDATKFIMLKVNYTTDSSCFDLDKIEPIQGFLDE